MEGNSKYRKVRSIDRGSYGKVNEVERIADG